MMKLLKSLFLTTDRAGSVIDATVKGLDAVVNTKEERQRLLLAWVAATGPTNVSRRLVAFVVAGIWSVYQAAILLMFGASVWFPGVLPVIQGITTHMNASINGGFMLVMGFYFAPHAIAAAKGTQVFQILKGEGDGKV
jgi:hypothetical protein